MSHRLRLTVMVLLVSLCGACQQQRQKSLSKQLGISMTEAELRESVNQLRAQALGEYESFANGILAESSNQALRTLAIGLKIRANEEVIRATTHPDPAVSLIDLWALTVQMQNFAQQPEVIERWHPYHDQFLESVDRVQNAVIEVTRTLSSEDEPFEETVNLITTYAEAHPLTGRLWRPSPAPLLAEYRERTGGGIFGNVQGLEEGVVDISSRLDILTTQLPKQILWHADLLVQYRLDEFGLVGDQLEQAVAGIQDVPAEIERHRTETLADFDRQRRDTLDIIDLEFDETLDQINAQRERTLADIDTQRHQTILAIDAQRVDTIEHLDETVDRALSLIDTQRVDTMDRIDGSVETVLASIDTQRADTVVRMEALADDTMQRTEAMITRVVNTIFIRTVVVLVIVFIGAAVLLVLWRKMA